MLISRVVFNKPVLDPVKGSQFGVSELASDAATTIRIEGAVLVVERDAIRVVYPLASVAVAFAELPKPPTTPAPQHYHKRR